jgi:DMSO/TMAO reductase YedYZ heme-binding membrane subunit
MQILKEYRDARRTMPLHGDTKYWIDTVLLSVIIYIFLVFYIGGAGGFFALRTVNLAVGYVSYVLVLLSMGMSSICYFWDFADRFMIYRKHLGIVGFVYAGFHFFLSLLLINQFVGFGRFFATDSNWIPFATGTLAFCILLFLTIISHGYAVRHLGGKLWRALLRMGYAAVVLSIIHIGARQYPQWFAWVAGESESLLPPLSLPTFALTCVILAWRLMMEYHLRLVAKKKAPTV